MKPKEQKPWLMGSLTPGKPGRHHVEPPLNLPPPTKVCNSSSREPLVIGPRTPARSGADDHKQFGSYSTWGKE